MATKKTTAVGQQDLSIFSLEVSPALITQAIYVYQENSHRGMSKVQTRGELGYTTKKVYKQKGTGNARHGSKSAPIFVGGGVVFGPRGLKSATKSLNKKMKIKALAGILSLYRKEDRLSMFEPKDIKSNSTKEAAKLLGDKAIAIVHFDESPDFFKAIGNLNNITLLSATRLNVLKVAQSPKIYITPSALTHLSERLQPVMSIKSAK
jgi:large subunit ribosomal protein L4